MTDPPAKAIFSASLQPDVLIANLTAYLRRELVPGETLILLDEIQECPQARTAIKFLVEDGRFDYVTSGSLLGVRTKEVSSLPVGFETPLQMLPMDFGYLFVMVYGHVFAARKRPCTMVVPC